MATLTVTVPDEQVDRVRVAFANRAQKEPQDVTAADVAAVLANYVKKVVRQHEELAANEAAQASVTDVDATS